MRIFRRISSGPYYYNKEDIVFQGDSDNMNPDLWREVVIVDKPEPKKQTFSIAVFKDPKSPNSKTFLINQANLKRFPSHYQGYKRLSDWKEVKFIIDDPFPSS